eukprot:Trichotokara_eunicae@DN5943_c0_g2_i1.p1
MKVSSVCLLIASALAKKSYGGYSHGGYGAHYDDCICTRPCQATAGCCGGCNNNLRVVDDCGRGGCSNVRVEEQPSLTYHKIDYSEEKLHIKGELPAEGLTINIGGPENVNTLTNNQMGVYSAAYGAAYGPQYEVVAYGDYVRPGVQYAPVRK